MTKVSIRRTAGALTLAAIAASTVSAQAQSYDSRGYDNGSYNNGAYDSRYDSRDYRNDYNRNAYGEPVAPPGYDGRDLPPPPQGWRQPRDWANQQDADGRYARAAERWAATTANGRARTPAWARRSAACWAR